MNKIFPLEILSLKRLEHGIGIFKSLICIQQVFLCVFKFLTLVDFMNLNGRKLNENLCCTSSVGVSLPSRLGAFWFSKKHSHFNGTHLRVRSAILIALCFPIILILALSTDKR